MNQPLRIGLVGAGMVSRHHLIAWGSIADQARVVALADPSADNAARRAAEFTIPNTDANAEAMLAAGVDRMEILGDKGAIKLDGAQLTCSGVSPQERIYDLATEYQGSYNRTIAHFVQSLRDKTPFETAPQDNLETLRLVEDCYRLSGWEALQ